MPSLDDLIAGARTARRATRDVDVTLDQAVAAQLEAIDGRIAALEQERVDLEASADVELAEANRGKRLADPRPAAVEEARTEAVAGIVAQIEAAIDERDRLADGTLLTFRFTQLPGQAWAEIGARHPARADVTIDRAYGYNYHEVAKAAAIYREPVLGPQGNVVGFGRGYSERILPADDPDTEPSSEPVSAEQWAGIFEVISGHEFERIASAIWDLNDYGPQQRIASAGKASRAGSGSRSSSLGRSGSARDGSPDGNPPAS